MYLHIPWQLVADPLGSAEGTLGTAAKDHSFCSLVTTLSTISCLQVHNKLSSRKLRHRIKDDQSRLHEKFSYNLSLTTVSILTVGLIRLMERVCQLQAIYVLTFMGGDGDDDYKLRPQVNVDSKPLWETYSQNVKFVTGEESKTKIENIWYKKLTFN